MTKNPGRIAGHDGIGRNIFGDHAARPDNRVFTNGGVAQDGGSRSDRRALLHNRAFDLPVGFRLEVPVRRRGPRVAVVDEGHAVTDEDVIFDDHALADKGMAGDLAAPPNPGVLLNLHEGADFAFVAHLTTIKVDEFGQPDVGAELYIVSNAVEWVHRPGEVSRDKRGSRACSWTRWQLRAS